MRKTKKRTYKVWVHLEEEIEGEEPRSLDDEELPIIAGIFDDKDKAIEFMNSLDNN